MPRLHVSRQLQTYYGVSMNNKVLYTIKWTQNYPEWERMVDNYTDMILKESQYKEANELIDKIKRNL